MTNFETIFLCEHCIEAIRSRGEKVFVGEHFENYDFDGTKSEEFHGCEWCEDDEVYDVYECHF